MSTLTYKRLVTEIFYASLRSVDPYKSVKHYTERIKHTYQKGNYRRLVVIGFGKEAFLMTKAVEDSLADLIDTAVVITKYGHKVSQKSRIKSFEAGHPVPDENGLKGTEEIIRLLNTADEKTLVVCLISGGGSALLVAPYEGITLSSHLAQHFLITQHLMML